MINCKRCEKQLTGKQTSYCSTRCSKLHLKGLYRKRNKEKCNTYNRKWKLANPEKYLQQKMNYYIKQFGCAYVPRAPKPKIIPNGCRLIWILECTSCGERFDSWTKQQKYCSNHSHKDYRASKKLRFEILKRDKFTCQYCGRKAPEVKLEVDHIVPRSKGGKLMKNLKTACYDCNIGKGANTL